MSKSLRIGNVQAAILREALEAEPEELRVSYTDNRVLERLVSRGFLAKPRWKRVEGRGYTCLTSITEAGKEAIATHNKKIELRPLREGEVIALSCLLAGDKYGFSIYSSGGEGVALAIKGLAEHDGDGYVVTDSGVEALSSPEWAELAATIFSNTYKGRLNAAIVGYMAAKSNLLNRAGYLERLVERGKNSGELIKPERAAELTVIIEQAVKVLEEGLKKDKSSFTILNAISNLLEDGVDNA